MHLHPTHTTTPRPTPFTTPLGNEHNTHTNINSTVRSMAFGGDGSVGRDAVGSMAAGEGGSVARSIEAVVGEGATKGKAVAAGVVPQQHKYMFCNPKIFGLQTTTSISQHAGQVPGSTNEDIAENGVTKDQKQMMDLWNSFVRKQRVLVDGDVPLACEAFTKLHGPDFIQNPGLLWCWKMLMMILWSRGLLDYTTMNNCNVWIEKLQ